MTRCKVTKTRRSTSPEAKRILNCLRVFNEPIRVQDIALLLDMTRVNVSQLLRKLRQTKSVKCPRYGYYVLKGYKWPDDLALPTPEEIEKLKAKHRNISTCIIPTPRIININIDDVPDKAPSKSSNLWEMIKTFFPTATRIEMVNPHQKPIDNVDLVP